MSIMKFGQKWKGQQVQEMAERDPHYCRWLINVPGFKNNHPFAYAQVREAVIQHLRLEAKQELY